MKRIAALALVVGLLAGCSNEVARERHGDGTCMMVNRQKLFGVNVGTNRAIVGCGEQ